MDGSATGARIEASTMGRVEASGVRGSVCNSRVSERMLLPPPLPVPPPLPPPIAVVVEVGVWEGRKCGGVSAEEGTGVEVEGD